MYSAETAHNTAATAERETLVFILDIPYSQCGPNRLKSEITEVDVCLISHA